MIMTIWLHQTSEYDFFHLIAASRLQNVYAENDYTVSYLFHSSSNENLQTSQRICIQSLEIRLWVLDGTFHLHG